MTGDERGEAERPAPTVLAGKRVLVTRRADQAGGLSERLRGYGAEVVEAPLIRIDPPTDIEAAAAAVSRLATYDYVVYTSVNAVAAVSALAAERGIDLSAPATRVIALGPATAEAVRAAGLDCEEVAEEFTSDGVADLLRRASLAGRRVLLPRSEIGRDELPAALRQDGALVDDVAVYTTNPDAESARRLEASLLGVDVLTFASGSAVAAFMAAVPSGWRRPDGLLVAAIGPATASAAATAGLRPDIVAAHHTAEGLADAVAAYFVRS